MRNKHSNEPLGILGGLAMGAAMAHMSANRCKHCKHTYEKKIVRECRTCAWAEGGKVDPKYDPCKACSLGGLEQEDRWAPK